VLVNWTGRKLSPWHLPLKKRDIFSPESVRSRSLQRGTIWNLGDSHVVTLIRVLRPVFRECRRRMNQPLIKDKWFQRILRALHRGKFLLDRTSISKVILGFKTYTSLSVHYRSTAMGNSNVRRYNFRAIAVIGDYFCYKFQ
jgi:hypothetical protein